MRKFAGNGTVVWIVFMVSVLTGCSPLAMEKFMRTFIDGSPQQENVSRVAVPVVKENDEKAPVVIGLSKNPEIIFHQPFAEQMCDSCHDSKFSQKLVAAGKDLCFTCHDDFTKGKKSVHYPVDSGDCTECHEPHQSLNKKLLKRPVPEICYTCHDEKEIQSQPQHEGQSECGGCHDPHVFD